MWVALLLPCDKPCCHPLPGCLPRRVHWPDVYRRARPDSPIDIENDEIDTLRGTEKHREYVRRCTHRKARFDEEQASVQAKAVRLVRRVKEQDRRHAVGESVRQAVDEQSVTLLRDAAEATEQRLSHATGALNSVLMNKGEIFVEELLRIWADADAMYTRSVAARCMDALKEPLRWKRAVSLANKWRLRRMLRICARLRAIDRHGTATRTRTCRLSASPLHRCASHHLAGASPPTAGCVSLSRTYGRGCT